MPRNAAVAASWARALLRPVPWRARLLAWLVPLRLAYREVFRGAARAVVIADLAHFCHLQSTTHVVGDPTGSAQLEGRRQVGLRIRGYLALTDEQLDEYRRQALAGEERA